MATSRVKVTTSGVIFSTPAMRARILRFLDGTKLQVAQQGENEVRARLSSVLRNPTGAYSSSIRTDRASRFNDQIVTDGGVGYGPWLESGKYTPPRRFKGYGTFRRVRTRLRKEWVPIAQSNLQRLIARLNS